MEKTHSRSSLFLIEMLIIILFLSLASAYCVEIFAASRKQSGEALELSMAEKLVGGAADLIRGSDNKEELDLTFYYPQGIPTEDGIRVYYDTAWNPCDRADSAYCMEIAVTEENDERSGRIRLLNAGQEEIYRLRAAVHIRYTAAGNGGD